MIVICDLDGTISDDTHRQGSAREEKWDKYNSLAIDDPPVRDVITVINSLPWDVHIWTGRPDKFREITEL